VGARFGAWCAAAALLLGVLPLAGGAGAEEAARCSPWRSAEKPNERIALRTCSQPAPRSEAADDDALEGDADEGEKSGGSDGAKEHAADAAKEHAADATKEHAADATKERGGEGNKEAAGGERAEVTFAVEIRSGYDEARKIRCELVTADGAVEALAATVKRGVNEVGACSKCAEHGDVRRFRVLEASSAKGEPGAKGGGDELRRVTGTMHMEVLARDLRLTAADAERLKRIAARYYKATRKRLIVTGGTRPPPRQARLMYDKLKHGQDIIALYENKQAATEVRDAYRDGVAKSLPRKRLLRALTELIEAQIARGVFVSKHLRSGAVDVRSWDMTGPLEQALRDAVKKEPGVTLLDERSGPEPHFHLSLPEAGGTR
jgi:hypothetical protein